MPKISMKVEGVSGAAAIAAALVALIGLGAFVSHRSAIEERKAVRAAHDTMTIAMSATCINLSGDPDRDFAGLMVPHHQGAVDMAKMELQYGHDPQIRDLAREVVASQQPQIAQISRWKQAHPAVVRSNIPAGREGFDAANKKMMSGMASGGPASSGNADLDFVRMMMPHHQGAVDMGQIELELGRDQELRALAHDIVVAQRAEIAQMTAWLRRNGH